MQPHQLEYFVAVAETGSFTAGADRVGVVQSAVSAAIKQLERGLGAPLIERGYHRLALTAEGEALLPRAREVLAGIEAAREAVAGARGQVVGTVLFGTLSYTGRWDIAEVLQGFAARHPGITVRLRQTIAGSATSEADVRSGALDLALVSTAADSLPGLTLTRIHGDELVFICAPGHRLARARAVSAADLAGETWVDFPTGWGNRTVVDAAFASAGVPRTVRTEVTNFELARNLVCRGLGVAVVPRALIEGDPGVIAVPIGLEWSFQLAVASNRRISAAAARLAEAVTASAM
ncbi:LysR family transcriptional regulator [Nocardioides sp. KC13]|uniref:LysR family transcriptional regulator n=1 Tax=Nocardioides turkmenicus TaxID=2711220 RepID=A0A6M1RDF0_9ACTN|nr:LysR family transcriptional regulator [Nocardioides sp. KC13]NGN95678.1 LysR family transcriptional regulator [Nocardioides sp. KC13]